MEKVLVNAFTQRALGLARNPTQSGITLISHALVFLRELYEQESVYKTQVAGLKKHKNFLQDLFQALAVLIGNQRSEDMGMIKCTTLTIAKCLLDILSHELLRPVNEVTGHLIAKFFSVDSQVLQEVLKLAGNPVDFERILHSLQEAENHFRNLQFSITLSDFSVFRPNLECWGSFFANSNPYGDNYQLDINSIRTVLLSSDCEFACRRPLPIPVKSLTSKDLLQMHSYLHWTASKRHSLLRLPLEKRERPTVHFPAAPNLP